MNSSSSSLSEEAKKSLIRSLIDSYRFKENSLVKRTVYVKVSKIFYHLVSYYTVADVMSDKLATPSKDSRFQQTIPRADLSIN
jgi:hypothetical protein